MSPENILHKIDLLEKKKTRKSKSTHFTNRIKN